MNCRRRLKAAIRRWLKKPTHTNWRHLARVAVQQ